MSGCPDVIGNGESVCGQGGTCLNTSNGWECACTDPWTNVADLVIDRTFSCYISIPGRTACWVILLLCWLCVFLYAGWTGCRMRQYVPYSARQRSELMLLCMKCFHSSLFMITAILAVSSKDRSIGTDLGVTICYAFAATFFWIEYMLFLIVPTLSSVTSIAYVIAPRPMRLYAMTAPVMLSLSTIVSFSVLAMIYHNGSDMPPEYFGTLHIELFGGIGLFFLGAHILAMTAILRKLAQMRSSSFHENTTSQQISKLGSVEVQIRALRLETILMFSVFPPSVLIYGLIGPLRRLSCYILPLSWGIIGLLTLRYIYMSDMSVRIHMRRARMEATSPGINNREKQDVDGDTREGNEVSRLSSTDASPMAKISKLARRRMRRKPKFINAMTRVEEERTNAMSTRVEEQFTVLDSNDVSRSVNS